MMRREHIIALLHGCVLKYFKFDRLAVVGVHGSMDLPHGSGNIYIYILYHGKYIMGYGDVLYNMCFNVN